MIPWDLGDGGWGVGFGWEKKSKDRREWGLANTGKGIMKLLRMSSNNFDIIRMECEGVEKAGVAGLMSGVQEMGIQREAENLEKRGWCKKMEKKSKSTRPDPVGACGTQILAFD